MKNIKIIKNVTFFAILVLILTGCMMKGMHRGGHMMGSKTPDSTNDQPAGNTDKLIKKAVSDLSVQNLDIHSIAVWQITSKTDGIDVEMIRQKLIAQLIELNRFKIISRQRLNDLLEEQQLSLTGTIDAKSAVNIGNLIGADGFIDGYASLENNNIVLSLTLIETKSGQIVWAKTVK